MISATSPPGGVDVKIARVSDRPRARLFLFSMALHAVDVMSMRVRQYVDCYIQHFFFCCVILKKINKNISFSLYITVPQKASLVVAVIPVELVVVVVSITSWGIQWPCSQPATTYMYMLTYRHKVSVFARAVSSLCAVCFNSPDTLRVSSITLAVPSKTISTTKWNWNKPVSNCF